MATCDVQTLLDDGKCFLCLSETQQLAVIAQLLCDIAAAGGGGGSGTGNITPGVVDPEGVVTADPGAMYFNTANSTLWVKASGTGNTGWVQTN